MQIKDYAVPVPHISLTDERGGTQSKSLSLHVYKPAIGPLAESFIPLEGCFHLENWASKWTKEVVAPSTFSTTSREEEVVVLNSSLHNGDPEIAKFTLPFVGFNVDKATWKTPSSFFGEACFTSHYWEWVEDMLGRHKDILTRAGIFEAVYTSRYSYDRCENILRAFFKYWCPSTNTLHTPVGELSITLWDLYRLDGLSIDGTFFDEVVPSARELLTRDKEGKPLLPESCRHLFSAYYHLWTNDQGVWMKDWIRFWFKGEARYRAPPNRANRRKTTSKPKMTYNPSGSVEPYDLADTNDFNVPFDILGIPESLRKETYIAAFIACWICKFLLPSKKVDRIRPSVFKVACLMATGKRFYLAIPVLASIYHGLREIVHAPNLGECGVTFPIHYVYAWIGLYFDVYHENNQVSSHHARMTRFSGEKMAIFYGRSEAEEIFKEVNPLRLPKLCWTENEEKVLIDDGSLSSRLTSYFISQRSCHLTLRKDNTFIIEKYNPCRFSRQFGFCQDIPNNLKEITHTYTLGEAIQLWDSSVRMQTRSRMTIPTHRKHPLITKDYDVWWSTRSNSVSSTPFKFTVKITQQSSKKGKVTSANEPVHPNGVIEIVTSLASSTLRKNQITSSHSKNIATKNKSSKDSRQAIKEAQPVVPAKKTPPKASKSLSATRTEEDVEIEMVDDHDSIEAIEKEGTQVQGIGSTQGGAHSLASGSSSQDRHWNRSKKRTSSDLEEISFTPPSVEVSPLKPPFLEFRQEGVGNNSPPELEVDIISNNKSDEIAISTPRQFAPNGDTSSLHKKELISSHEIRKRPKAVLVSEFHGQKLIQAHRRKYLQSLWMDFHGQILDTPTEQISSLKECAEEIITEITRTDPAKGLPLKDHLMELFAKAEAYDVLAFSSWERMNKETHAELLSKATVQLEKIKAKGEELTRHLQSLEEELQSIEARKKVLQQKLIGLEKQSLEITSTIDQKHETFKEIQVEITQAHDELSSIEQTSILTDDSVKELEDTKSALESYKVAVVEYKFDV
ncbi:uncharacterized protein [Coffea arabica]|uniref:Aminotransferase-like plant mobile domain-containing protein n=1 Tax=Coffea arabica TaxID=13443 RepID=A0ABM4UKD9_COFAR